MGLPAYEIPVGEPRPPRLQGEPCCYWCGNSLRNSPSEWWCQPECQRRWLKWNAGDPVEARQATVTDAPLPPIVHPCQAAVSAGSFEWCGCGASRVLWGAWEGRNTRRRDAA